MRAISAPGSPDRAELFDELRGLGFDILPGQMGENVATSGVDLLGLAIGTRLRLGEAAIVEVTGLHNRLRAARPNQTRPNEGDTRS